MYLYALTAQEYEERSIDYDTAMEEMTEAERQGSWACHEFQQAARAYFSWKNIKALDLYEALRKEPYCKPFLKKVRDLGVERIDFLWGIEEFLFIRCEAECRAHAFAKAIATQADAPAPWDVRDDDVDNFISQESEWDDELFHIRMMNPVLYTEICVETSRLLREFARVAELNP
jgi:hypothetical protein